MAGAEDFRATIETVDAEHRPLLLRLSTWAESLEQRALARVYTYHGVAQRWTLLPRLQPDDVGLVTIWNEGRGYIQFWRSVLERKAPKTLPKIEALIAPDKVGQGSSYSNITDELLDLLTQAYLEGNSRL